MGDGQYLTFTAAAKELGISRATLSEIVRRGEVEAFQTRLNRKVRLVRASDLQELREGAVTKVSRELTVA